MKSAFLFLNLLLFTAAANAELRGYDCGTYRFIETRENSKTLQLPYFDLRLENDASIIEPLTWVDGYSGFAVYSATSAVDGVILFKVSWHRAFLETRNGTVACRAQTF